ncbi:hypothetical protein BH23CHL8_BH23CHL8_11550 [soil metagenome]
MKRSSMPRDPNQRAKAVVDIATHQREADPPAPPKDPAAVALGRKGGLKGGKARAEHMTAEERSESARRAAFARWGNASAS